MASSRFERLFEDLDAGFEAALSREEDVAADDLALALQQDTGLAVAASRGGWLVTSSATQAPLTEIGSDYLMARQGDFLRVMSHDGAILTSDPSIAPARSAQRSLLELLRSYVRIGAELEVLTAQGTFRGRLARAASDHLLVHSADRDLIIPNAAVIEVRVARI